MQLRADWHHHPTRAAVGKIVLPVVVRYRVEGLDVGTLPPRHINVKAEYRAPESVPCHASP